MTFLVELAMSPAAVFQYPIDGVVVVVPDEFCPRAGDTVDFRQLLGVDRALVAVGVMVVVDVRWTLRPSGPPQHQHPWHFVFPGSSAGRVRMRLTLSSESPPDRKTRKVHPG